MLADFWQIFHRKLRHRYDLTRFGGTSLQRAARLVGVGFSLPNRLM
jgi:hypothetical protein